MLDKKYVCMFLCSGHSLRLGMFSNLTLLPDDFKQNWSSPWGSSGQLYELFYQVLALRCENNPLHGQNHFLKLQINPYSGGWPVFQDHYMDNAITVQCRTVQLLLKRIQSRASPKGSELKKKTYTGYKESLDQCG